MYIFFSSQSDYYDGDSLCPTNTSFGYKNCPECLKFVHTHSTIHVHVQSIINTMAVYMYNVHVYIVHCTCICNGYVHVHL